MAQKDMLKEMFMLTRKQTMELLKSLELGLKLDEDTLRWQARKGLPHIAWLLGRVGLLSIEMATKTRSGLNLPAIKIRLPKGDYDAKSRPSPEVPDLKALLLFLRDSGLAVTRTLDDVGEAGIEKAPNPKHPTMTVARRLMKIVQQEAGCRGQIEFVAKLYLVNTRLKEKRGEEDIVVEDETIRLGEDLEESAVVNPEDRIHIPSGARPKAGRLSAQQIADVNMLKEPTELYFGDDPVAPADAEADEPNQAPIVKPIDRDEEAERRPSKELPRVEEADPPELHDL